MRGAEQVKDRASLAPKRADGDPHAAAERIRFAAPRREVRLGEGYRASSRAAPGILAFGEATVPDKLRTFRQSIAPTMRRFLCADWRRDSGAKAQNFRAKYRMLRADNPTAERCGD